MRQHRLLRRPQLHQYTMGNVRLVGPRHDDLGEGHKECGVVRRRQEVPAAAVRAVVVREARLLRRRQLHAHRHAAAGRGTAC